MSKDGSRVDADELHRKARDARPQQILRRDLANGPRAAKCLRAEPPQVPEQQNSEKEFVNRRGVNAAIERLAVVAANLGAGNKAVEEAHSPGDIGRNTVVAIA